MPTNTKHTPGPWEGQNAAGLFYSDHAWSVENDDSNITESAPIHHNGKIIALVVSTQWDSAELLANAALIAAAPTLAEKLLACKAMCDRMIDQHDGVCGGVDFHALAKGVDEALTAAGVL
jgi:hypothetical protein